MAHPAPCVKRGRNYRTGRSRRRSYYGG